MTKSKKCVTEFGNDECFLSIHIAAKGRQEQLQKRRKIDFKGDDGAVVLFVR
jgi:hypothetical protein